MEYVDSVPGVIVRDTRHRLRQLPGAGTLDTDWLAAQWQKEKVSQQARPTGWRKGEFSTGTGNNLSFGFNGHGISCHQEADRGQAAVIDVSEWAGKLF